jgi:excisionase family DNA binding protein
MAEFLKAAEAAGRLHISPKTLARWAKDGRIPSVRTPGGHRRYDPVVIAEWEERLADIGPIERAELVRR